MLEMVTGGIGDHKKMKKRFTRSKVNGGKWEEQNISHVHIFFFSHFLLLFKYSCLHFPPTQPSPLPTLDPTPFDFVHVSFIHVPENPSPFSLFPPLSPPLPSGYCLFLISMSLVIFCLLICFID